MAHDRFAGEEISPANLFGKMKVSAAAMPLGKKSE